MWMEISYGKTTLQKSSMLLQTRHLALHMLSTTCVHSVSYFASQTNGRKNVFEYSLVADIISILWYFLHSTYNRYTEAAAVALNLPSLLLPPSPPPLLPPLLLLLLLLLLHKV